MPKTSFWASFRLAGPKFGPPIVSFKNLALSVTRCHGQLSSCTISEKADDPILKKFSDGRTNRRTDIVQHTFRPVDKEVKTESLRFALTLSYRVLGFTIDDDDGQVEESLLWSDLSWRGHT